jgi:hypothetical protein
MFVSFSGKKSVEADSLGLIWWFHDIIRDPHSPQLSILLSLGCGILDLTSWLKVALEFQPSCLYSSLAAGGKSKDIYSSF